MEVTLWVTLSVREGEGESGRLGWGSPHTHTHTFSGYVGSCQGGRVEGCDGGHTLFSPHAGSCREESWWLRWCSPSYCQRWRNRH